MTSFWHLQHCMKSWELSPCQIWEKCRLSLISMGNLVIFVVGLLGNWLVKVTETFTDILNYYVLQTTANKFAVHEKVYVVKKYLKYKVRNVYESLKLE